MRIYDNIMETIGATPLIRMQRIGKGLPADVVLKCEFFNPLGSVKDRIGRSMIEQAEREGKLLPGMSVLEPTSGNTGVALAFVCAAKGYPLTLVMPESMSLERRTLLLLLGAQVVLTPAVLGMRGAIAKARELSEGNPDIFVASQFDNSANPKAHREATALEIWDDTDGRVDIVVCGVGTGGTATGVGEVLKAKKPSVQLVAVEPAESPVISGGAPGVHKIQGIGAGFIPHNLRVDLVDAVERVTSDEAIAMSRRLIREEGIPVGMSAGAALCAALRVAACEENRGKLIVVIIPSGTERYLSTILAAEERDAASRLPVSEVAEVFMA